MEHVSTEYKKRLKALRELQLAELGLIRQFVQICEKENLTYFMLGGTMLGAVRHKGFIPWDDDADFGMPREDYDTFLKVAGKYLTGDTHLSVFGEEGHFYFFSQLVDRKIKIAFHGRVEKLEGECWIDIFPLDGMPENRIMHTFHKVRLLFLRKLYLLSNFEKEVQLYNSHRTFLNRVGVLICKNFKIYRFFHISKIWNLIDKELKAYPCNKSTYYLNLMGAYKFKELFKKDVFGEGAFYDFEGMKLRGPEQYDFYLTQLYGDYMTPPPEIERNKHNTQLVED